MSYIVSIYILFVNGLYSFYINKKYVLYSTLFFMVLLFGGIYDCADDMNYQLRFEVIKKDGFMAFGLSEIGFSLFTLFWTKVGLSYKLYRTIIAIIGLSLISKTVVEFTKKFNFVFLLYFIFPFIFDVIQIRNFLASSIIIYSIRFLVNSSKKGIIKYTIGILIASSVHYMSVFFLPLIFVNKFSVKELTRIAIFLTPLLSILTNSSLIPNLVRSIFGDEIMFDLDGYFQRANWGFILLWIKQLIIFSIVYSCYIIVKNDDIVEEWQKLNRIIIKLNIYLIIIGFPLLIFNGNFSRLFRNIFILNYILISQVMYINLKKGLIYSLITILLILFYLGSSILTELNIKNVLIPFFQSNSYF